MASLAESSLACKYEMIQSVDFKAGGLPEACRNPGGQPRGYGETWWSNAISWAACLLPSPGMHGLADRFEMGLLVLFVVKTERRLHPIATLPVSSRFVRWVSHQSVKHKGGARMTQCLAKELADGAGVLITNQVRVVTLKGSLLVHENVGSRPRQGILKHRPHLPGRPLPWPRRPRPRGIASPTCRPPAPPRSPRRRWRRPAQSGWSW